MNSTSETTCQPFQLVPGEFFQYGNHGGQVYSLSRPRTDYPYNGPATHWDIEYVMGPDDDEPVYRVRIPVNAVVEVWS